MELKPLIDQFGLPAAIAIFLIYKHYLEPKIKKANGTFVSYKELNEKIGIVTARVNTTQDSCDKRFEDYGEFLKLEAKEDLRMKEIEMKTVHLERVVETENKHIFNQLGSLHDKMDSLTSILLQQKK